MRFPSFQPNPLSGAQRGEPRSPSLLDHVLPPDPKPPTRPTIPPDNCGTLPPKFPSLIDRLLGSRKPGR